MTTSRRSGTELREIDLFSSENPGGPDLGPVKSYLKSLLPSVSVKVLPPALRRIAGTRAEAIARRLAMARVKDIGAADQDFEPMFGEVEYELRTLAGKARLGGVVYDARKVAEAVVNATGQSSSLRSSAIVFTDRLISTYSRDDMRHHLRTVLCGFPSIISVPGIVEAPAKPREYYVLKQRMESEGASDLQLAELRASFRDRFIDHGDEGVVEVMKGLALQAVMYHLTLTPFCSDKNCRLFNAHWQEDLIKSQVRSKRLCVRHAAQLEALGKSPVLRWS